MSSYMEKSAPTNKIWTPSNLITLLRICLVPVFVVALLSPWPEWFGVINVVSNSVKAVLAAVVFALISCTDWIDGYLARSRNEVTDLGKFLDPLADKILVTAALIALVELQTLPAWPVLIILTREFIVSGIRMMAASKGYVIAASWYGKAKTVLQIIAIILFLIKDYVIQYSEETAFKNPFYDIAWIVMLIALVLTVLSMVDYINKARPILGGSKAPLTNEQLAARVISLLRNRDESISTAESLTGGMIAGALTSVAGSSEAFRGGFVTYAISSKSELLSVDDGLLDKEGAVNADVARQMAEGAADRLETSFAISATGIAGPGGAEPGKPVGTVFMGFFHNGKTEVEKYELKGDRDSIRSQCVTRALTKASEMLEIEASGQDTDFDS